MKYFSQRLTNPVRGGPGKALVPFQRYGPPKDSIGIVALDEADPNQAQMIADLETMVKNGHIGSVDVISAEQFEAYKKKVTPPPSPVPSRSPFGRNQGFRLAPSRLANPLAARRAAAGANLTPAQRSVIEAEHGAPFSVADAKIRTLDGAPPKSIPNAGVPKPVA